MRQIQPVTWSIPTVDLPQYGHVMDSEHEEQAEEYSQLCGRPEEKKLLQAREADAR